MPRNAIERLNAADYLVTLIATGLQLRHPQSMKMARLNLEKMLWLRDDQVDILTARMEAWISEQRGAIAAPKVGA